MRILSVTYSHASDIKVYVNRYMLKAKKILSTDRTHVLVYHVWAVQCIGPPSEQ